MSTFVSEEFGTVSDAVRFYAAERPTAPMLIVGNDSLDCRSLDMAMDRVAVALQRDGCEPGSCVAVCAATSLAYACTYLGAVRAGVTVAPLPPYASPKSLRRMISDAGAKLLFLDRESSANLRGLDDTPGLSQIWLSGSDSGSSWNDWLSPTGEKPGPVAVDPQGAFNIIYSSGTTGTPKGVVQSYAMRWAQAQRSSMGLGTDSVTILSTHFYSNLTLSMFFQSVSNGALVVLMPKFDPEGFLALVERYRATHVFLVPTQYQRIMTLPNFSTFDLGSLRMKFCASAPFPPTLKADVADRFAGHLVEIYGMTEGGGMTMLDVKKRRDKVASVGQPVDGHDFRVIDEAGNELPPGSVGEIVGRSNDMMSGYHNQPQKTKEAEWHDAEGRRFICTGDVG